MGRNRSTNTRAIIDNELPIKSNSSSSMIGSAINRGSYVENPHKACGKSTQKCGKRSGKYSGKREKLTPIQAETRADALISIFNAPNCREFFLKCIYHLSVDEIQDAVSYSSRPEIMSPVRYFNKICKQKLIERGL